MNEINHTQTDYPCTVDLASLEKLTYRQILKVGYEFAETSLLLLRWPDQKGKPTCPSCGKVDRVYATPGMGKYTCTHKHGPRMKGKAFTLKTDTVFNHSGIDGRETLAMIYAVREGVPLKSLAKSLNRKVSTLDTYYNGAMDSFGGLLTFPKVGEVRVAQGPKKLEVIKDGKKYHCPEKKAMARLILEYGTRLLLADMGKMFPDLDEDQMYRLYADLFQKPKKHLEAITKGLDPYAESQKKLAAIEHPTYTTRHMVHDY